MQELQVIFSLARAYFYVYDNIIQALWSGRSPKASRRVWRFSQKPHKLNSPNKKAALEKVRLQLRYSVIKLLYLRILQTEEVEHAVDTDR